LEEFVNQCSRVCNTRLSGKGGVKMSSTNRGGQREASDYYKTPVDEVKRFLTEARKDFDMLRDLSKLSILDPCAGGDVMASMSYPEALYSLGAKTIETVDIREDSKADIKADYLNTRFTRRFDLILTNPPFALAQQVIEKVLLDDAKPGGLVIMLLRLNYFGSSVRFNFWQRFMPVRVYVHHKRISFTGGTTDSIEYMHAVWKAGESPRETMLRVI
jgi:predicted RNA methylase